MPLDFSSANKRISARGIVLSKTPLRESDLIIRVLTERYGKLSLLARGAKNSKRRFSGALDLFDSALFEFGPLKRSQDLFLLHSASQTASWTKITKEMKRFCFAALALELCDCVSVEGDRDQAQLYNSLLQALDRLNVAQSRTECLFSFVSFNISLLAFSGINPLEDPEFSERVGLKQESLSLLRRIADGANISANEQVLLDIFFPLLSYSEEAIGRRLRSSAAIGFC